MPKSEWIDFMKQHRGKGLDVKEIAKLYRDQGKGKQKCVQERAEIARLQNALAVKKRQLAAFLN